MTRYLSLYDVREARLDRPRVVKDAEFVLAFVVLIVLVVVGDDGYLQQIFSHIHVSSRKKFRVTQIELLSLSFVKGDIYVHLSVIDVVHPKIVNSLNWIFRGCKDVHDVRNMADTRGGRLYIVWLDSRNMADTGGRLYKRLGVIRWPNLDGQDGPCKRRATVIVLRDTLEGESRVTLNGWIFRVGWVDGMSGWMTRVDMGGKMTMVAWVNGWGYWIKRWSLLYLFPLTIPGDK